ncbi:MAG: L-threonylcarbamoyladenylate synthase [Enterocloster sp.]|nr:L-threonylcarbamoyladenylate synthase [Enterocloster sp.]
METKKIKINDTKNINDEELKEAAQILRDGGLVAFPTETVYGLGGNALDEKAAGKIYAAKGRPSDNPLIAHVSCAAEVTPLVKYIPEAGRKLMDAFWPGPLTIIFPKSDIVPYGTTGGLDTVAVRMPVDPVANRLIALAGVPVAAPSANTSGRPSPTTADHVWQDLNGKIEMIIDGGPVGIGVESTIVDVSGDVPAVLRPGAITMEMLKDVLGEVTIDPAILGPMAEGVRPKAPGMKYKHYAPKADLTLVEPANVADARKTGKAVAMTQEQVEQMVKTVWKLAKEKLDAGYKVGIICTDESRSHYPQGEVRSIGARKSQESVAHNLYALLREFDDLKVDYIFSESFTQDHLGQAIMNRLSKAAGYQIYKV